MVVNVNWIGDAVFSTPVFRALKQTYPGAQVSCLAVPRIVPVLRCCPWVDEIIVYDEQGVHKSLSGKLLLISLLRRRCFDAAFFLHRSRTRAWFAFLAGIPRRIGYNTKRLGFLLTHKAVQPPAGSHRADRYLNVIESFGVPVRDGSVGLKVDQGMRQDIARLLQACGIGRDDPLCVVHVAGNWQAKRWPAGCFAELIGRVNAETPLKVVIPSAPADRDLVDDVVRRAGSNPVVLAGKTSLEQLIALMDRARVVVSSDSGPLHIASAVGTPVVAIFGPTRPEETGPRGQGETRVLQEDVGCNREPCYDLECRKFSCISAVSVNKVLDAVKEFCQKNNGDADKGAGF